jgi:N-acetyl-anhydromuramoyl-L-alanine amidase
VRSALRDEPIVTLRERLRINEEGLAEGVQFIPSPNCGERPAGCTVDLIVLHAISLPPGEFGGTAIEELFTNRLHPSAHPYYATLAGLKVSTHFLIRRDGELIQFVACKKRAWHAGESSWKGRTRCNDFSIGIELEGTDELPFTDQQYGRLAELTRALKVRYPIADIAGHSDVAPGRKSDPGPRFDWARYRAMVEKSSLPGTQRMRSKSRRKAEPQRTRRTQRKSKAPGRQGRAKKKRK